MNNLIVIRRSICDRCPTPCDLMLKDLSDESLACPIGRWKSKDWQQTVTPPTEGCCKGTKPWGPALWQKIHLRPLLFIFELCISDQDFLESLSAKIPCEECRSHYQNFLKDNPLPYYCSAWTYFQWTVKLHNYVNQILGKPIVSLDQAKDLWEKKIARLIK